MKKKTMLWGEWNAPYRVAVLPEVGVHRMKPPLQRLNDKHRRAAQLMVRGLSLVEISRELGYGPNYWSRLRNESPVFQECLAVYRRQDERAYAASIERMYCEVFRLDELRDWRKARMG